MSVSLALGLHELVPNRLSLRCGDPLYRKQAEERERVLRVSCSSVREMDCLREETVSCVWSFWCSELCSVDQTVTVQKVCAGCEGSRVIIPALLLTLDKCSS